MNGNRFMRIMLFFDLEVDTNEKLRQYNKFRKFLINEGFIMYQYSIYVKLLLNPQISKLYIKKIRDNSPNTGVISVIVITEKQFSRIVDITGRRKSEVDDTLNRIIFF